MILITKYHHNYEVINNYSRRNKWSPENYVAYERYFFTGEEYDKFRTFSEDMSDQTIQITPYKIAHYDVSVRNQNSEWIQKRYIHRKNATTSDFGQKADFKFFLFLLRLSGMVNITTIVLSIFVISVTNQLDQWFWFSLRALPATLRRLLSDQKYCTEWIVQWSCLLNNWLVWFVQKRVKNQFALIVVAKRDVMFVEYWKQISKN